MHPACTHTDTPTTSIWNEELEFRFTLIWPVEAELTAPTLSGSKLYTQTLPLTLTLSRPIDVFSLSAGDFQVSNAVLSSLRFSRFYSSESDTQSQNPIPDSGAGGDGGGGGGGDGDGDGKGEGEDDTGGADSQYAYEAELTVYASGVDGE